MIDNIIYNEANNNTKPERKHIFSFENNAFLTFPELIIVSAALLFLFFVGFVSVFGEYPMSD